jgi:hypothetical protein
MSLGVLVYTLLVTAAKRQAAIQSHGRRELVTNLPQSAIDYQSYANGLAAGTFANP